VLYESKSRNTYENAVLSKALANPKSNETWLLVTSAAHLPRSVGIFQKLNWQVTPVPCDYEAFEPSWLALRTPLDAMMRARDAFREWIGLVVYRLTGKTDSVFPGSSEN